MKMELLAISLVTEERNGSLVTEKRNGSHKVSLWEAKVNSNYWKERLQFVCLNSGFNY